MADLGTVIVVEETCGSVKKILFDWLSEDGGDDGGKAQKTTTKAYNGCLERVVFIPDGGETQPDDAYDVEIQDEDGYDVLCGLGANLSNAAYVSKSHADGLGAVANDKLTVVVSGANNAKGGVVIVYLR